MLRNCILESNVYRRKSQPRIRDQFKTEILMNIFSLYPTLLSLTTPNMLLILGKKTGGRGGYRNLGTIAILTKFNGRKCPLFVLLGAPQGLKGYEDEPLSKKTVRKRMRKRTRELLN